jgi:hypothetical protein
MGNANTKGASQDGKADAIKKEKIAAKKKEIETLEEAHKSLEETEEGFTNQSRVKLKVYNEYDESWCKKITTSDSYKKIASIPVQKTSLTFVQVAMRAAQADCLSRVQAAKNDFTETLRLAQETKKSRLAVGEAIENKRKELAEMK